MLKRAVLSFVFLAVATVASYAQCTGGITGCPAATSVNPSDYFVISQQGGTGPTGYVTRKATGSQVATGILGAFLGNPTAQIGLTPINGTAATALRSDGAPALSQSIVPNWSGLHTFGAGIASQSAVIGNPTLGNLGTGSINATGIFINGASIATPGPFGLYNAVPLAVGSGYVPGDVSTLFFPQTTVASAKVVVINTSVVSATVTAGGNSCTGTTATLTGTTGNGALGPLGYFTATAPVSAGAIQNPVTITSAGQYNINPTNLAAEPVTGSSCSGATLNISMGVLYLAIQQPGNYTGYPPSFIGAQTATTGVGTGLTVTASFSGLSAGVLPPSQASGLSLGNVWKTNYGYLSLSQQTTGTENTGYGFLTLSTLTTANQNSAFGVSVLSGQVGMYTMTGGQNNGFGTNALRNNIDGSGMSAFGVYALGQANHLVGGNAAFGNFAAQGMLSSTFQDVAVFGQNGFSGANFNGSWNTGIGSHVGMGLTTGTFNVLAGYNTGSAITTGNHNVVIGPQVGATTMSTGLNNILIGVDISCDTPTASTNGYFAICAQPGNGESAIAATGSSYNGGTGVVSLNLSTTTTLAPGNPVFVSGVTGTGANLASVDGYFIAGAGTGGTTLNFTIATGLTISTITGGKVTSNLSLLQGNLLYTAFNLRINGPTTIMAAPNDTLVVSAHNNLGSGPTLAAVNGSGTLNVPLEFDASKFGFYGGPVNVNLAGSAGSPSLTVGNGTTGLFSASTTGIGLSVNGASVADWGIGSSTNWSFYSTGGFQFQVSSSTKLDYGFTAGGTVTVSAAFAVGGTISATLASASGTNAVCNTPGTKTALTVQVWATGCAVSSARFKEDIEAISPQRALADVVAFQAIKYRYRDDAKLDRVLHVGFTAEQVGSIDPQWITYEADGTTPHAVKYQEMAPLLAAAIKQLKADNDNLRAEIEALKTGTK